jgi:glucose/arabinose dehydrogenase
LDEISLNPKSLKTCHIIFSLIVTISAVKIARCQSLVPFAVGLTSTVSIANAGDSRFFVVNQRGTVIIVDSTGNLNPEAFLDISDRVVYGGERGLLGIAFHPEYKTNGHFYVNYVGVGDSTHISRFSVKSGNPQKADSLSEYKILTIAQPFQNHKGGNLCFGPDGYLYIGMGDGGSGGDPGDRAQNQRVLLGKMLRIDIDHGSPYSIPVSNPFYNSNITRNEIWALGLRNPWKFSFDRLTGDLWIGDVGQNLFEEIDFQPAGSAGGENYGWRCYEGNQAFNTENCDLVSSYAFPVFTYSHESDCSVTGGYVYRGDSSSPYYGHYFFADYCSDRIWTLHNEAGQWVKEDFGQFLYNGFCTFGEDYKGELYIAGLSSGNIYRLTGQFSGLPESEKPIDIKIFQSQSSNWIRLEIDGDIPAETSVRVYDIKGIERFRTKMHDNTFEFSLDGLLPGIYVLAVVSDGNKLVNKIVVGR